MIISIIGSIIDLVMQQEDSEKSPQKRKKESAFIMRKQTKVVAVLSAAALLAIGASMTSFAASGKWVEENGTWVYYNRSGEKVTEEWAKSGDYWYWLNEDGEMATDTLVEDDENHYYVNENGTMVQNRWIAVENEDYDGSDDEEPMNYWYYFGSNGKAYKSGTNSNNASFKTINGKKYIFDDEGRMLYGWINTEGERETGDDAWQHADYYCGGENDGAQKAGEWAYLDIIDDGYDDDVAGQSSKNLFDDEDQTRWFYFKTNGKKIVGKKGETINGRKYSFDDYGRMNAEWVYYKNGDTSVATPTTATTVQGTKDYTTGFRYYGDPESGARKTKGWFQVVPDENLQADKYNDDEDFWYYSDKDGKLVASEMKTIDGKKYAFDEYGRMKSGLKAIAFDGTSTTKIVDILADDNSGHPFDTKENFDDNISWLNENDYALYYFGGGDDGAVKTGKQTVSIDGESFTFLFNKSGSRKGQGKFGLDNEKYYAGGMLMAAPRDEKYAVVKVTSKDDKYLRIELMDTEEFIDEMREIGFGNDYLKGDADDYEEYYNVKAAAKDTKNANGEDVIYRVVNTAGTVQKSKSRAKDGSDRCYQIGSNKQIEAVFVED